MYDGALTLLEYWRRYNTVIAIQRKWKCIPGEEGEKRFPTLCAYDRQLQKLVSCSNVLAEKPMAELSAHDFGEALTNLQKEGYITRETNSQYSVETIRGVMSVLNDIYSFAQDREDASNIIWSHYAYLYHILDQAPIGTATRGIMAIVHDLENKQRNPRNAKRSLTLREEQKLYWLIRNRLQEDGRYCLLAIALYTGLRPSEARALCWGDLRKIKASADAYYLNVFKTLTRTGEPTIEMKTLNAYRRVPVNPELWEILSERYAYISQFVTVTEDMPIGCYQNQYNRRITSAELEIFAKSILNGKIIEHQSYAEWIDDIRDEDFQDNEDRVAAEEAVTYYILRKHFLTAINARTKLSVMDRQYVMGHAMRMERKDMRGLYNDMERLYDIWEKMSKYYIDVERHDRESAVTLGTDPKFVNRRGGMYKIILTPEALAKGGTLRINAKADDPSLAIILRQLSSMKQIGGLDVKCVVASEAVEPGPYDKGTNDYELHEAMRKAQKHK